MNEIQCSSDGPLGYDTHTSPWRWRQHGPLNPTSLHDVI